MSASDVRINIHANGSAAFATFNRLDAHVKGLAGNIGGTLKHAIIGIVGVGSFTALAHSMASFAEQVKNASNLLGLTTNRVQELRRIARESKLDFGIFSGVFRNVESFGRKGQVKGSKEANVAAALGLTQEDLRTKNKDELLKLALKGTIGMDRAKAEGLLGTVVGPKAASKVLGIREHLLENQKGLVSNEDIENMAAFHDALEEVSHTIVESLLPALVKFGEATIGWAQKTFNLLVVGSNRKKILEEESKRTGEGDFAKLGGRSATVLWDKFKRIWSTADDTESMVKTYGELAVRKADAYLQNEPRAQLTDPNSFSERIRKKAEERAKANALLAGDVNREKAVTKSPEEKMQDSLFNPSHNDNNFLRIGGTRGINLGYEAHKIQEEQLYQLKRIAKATEEQAKRDNERDVAPPEPEGNAD